MSELAAALSQLESKVVYKRMKACRDLATLGRREAVAPLLRHLGEGEDPAVRQEAAQALAALGDPSALPALELTPAPNNPHEDYGEVSTAFGHAASRLRAGLSATERREDLRRLVEGLRHDDPHVVHRCQQGLADWGAEALPGLEPLLAHRDPEVRVIAVTTVENIRRKGEMAQQVVSLLLPLVDDRVPAVRRSVALALRYQRDPRLAPRLIPRLRDPDPAVRLQAMLTLETIDAFEAMDEIARMAEEDHAVLGPYTRLDASAASVLQTLRRKRDAR